MLRDAFINGAVAIANKKREVDELNVYPVPDGDTGTNMSMTMNNAFRELQVMDDFITVSQVADATASALLRGARGNSGVILSLLFKGFAKAFAGKKEADCYDFCKALETGVESAYKAVMNPTEGTILTVARIASDKAKSVLGDNAGGSCDIISLWTEVCRQAEITLEETPELLPVLKKAGVVDAGGMGIVIIWNSMLDIFMGKSVISSVTKTDVSVDSSVSGTVVGDADGEIVFGYCTELSHPSLPLSFLR